MVTGAGSGIGEATALEFARNGYTVIAVGRRKARLDATVAKATSLTGRIIAVQGDVGDPDDVERVTRQACEAGKYSVLVNNAGVGWQFGVDKPGSMAAPMGRPGTPQEIAKAIYFMAVDATYCNGAVLVADGGSLA